MERPANWGNGHKVDSVMLMKVAREELPPEMSDCPECGACTGVNIDCDTCIAVGILWQGMFIDGIPAEDNG
jgi:hypothetical protein